MQHIWSNVQFEEAIKNGYLKNVKDKANIQPASFDLSLGQKAYKIDKSHYNLFRLSEEIAFTDLVAENNLQEIDISEGFTVKVGQTYLVPVNEYFELPYDVKIKASPKSSLGRLFVSLRLISDYSPLYNEAYNTANKKVHFWLLIHPLAFDIVIHPNDTLCQIRVAPDGFEAIQGAKLKNLLDEQPILYNRSDLQKKAPHLVTDSLCININLFNENPSVPVAYKAVRSEIPIDLSRRNFYSIEDFFEPIFSSKEKILKMKYNGYYLIASKELLKVPQDISVELQEHSNIGFEGPFHFAGFIDNGFIGDLVFEIRLDEPYPEFTIFDGMSISKLNIFKTEMPNILYGENNNNYKFQTGVRVAKYFKYN